MSSTVNCRISYVIIITVRDESDSRWVIDFSLEFLYDIIISDSRRTGYLTVSDNHSRVSSFLIGIMNHSSNKCAT